MVHRSPRGPDSPDRKPARIGELEAEDPHLDLTSVKPRVEADDARRKDEPPQPKADNRRET